MRSPGVQTSKGGPGARRPGQSYLVSGSNFHSLRLRVVSLANKTPKRAQKTWVHPHSPWAQHYPS